MVENVRISLGTAIVIGLENGPKQDHFSTAFIMTYSESGCVANCAFCPQAVESSSDHRLLSRIGWPLFSFEKVLSGISEAQSLKRICIQTLNYANVIEDLKTIVIRIRNMTKIPISVCIHPISTKDMQELKLLGIDNIGIAVDACNEELFNSIKGMERRGPYTWSGHINAIRNAQSVFGKSNVTTHLIVGLGEKESELSEFLFKMKEMGVRVGLFAFTGIRGTALEEKPQPNIGTYRRIQILRDLIMKNLISKDQIHFNDDGRIEFDLDKASIRESLSSGTAFRVTGCVGCNRPFYNERPSGPMYNYPRPLKKEEIESALNEAGLVN